MGISQKEIENKNIAVCLSIKIRALFWSHHLHVTLSFVASCVRMAACVKSVKFTSSRNTQEAYFVVKAY